MAPFQLPDWFDSGENKTNKEKKSPQNCFEQEHVESLSREEKAPLHVRMLYTSGHEKTWKNFYLLCRWEEVRQVDALAGKFIVRFQRERFSVLHLL